MSKLFEACRDAGRELQDSNYCVITAISIVTGIEFKTVHKMAEKYGREKNKGTSLIIMFHILNDLGYAVTKTAKPRSEKWVKCVYSDNKVKRYGMYTPKTIGKVRGYKSGKWICYTENSTGSHVLSLVNGKVHDWSSDRKLRISKMWKIERKNSHE